MTGVGELPILAGACAEPLTVAADAPGAQTIKTSAANSSVPVSVRNRRVVRALEDAAQADPGHTCGTYVRRTAERLGVSPRTVANAVARHRGMTPAELIGAGRGGQARAAKDSSAMLARFFQLAEERPTDNARQIVETLGQEYARCTKTVRTIVKRLTGKTAGALLRQSRHDCSASGAASGQHFARLDAADYEHERCQACGLRRFVDRHEPAFVTRVCLNPACEHVEILAGEPVPAAVLTVATVTLGHEPRWCGSAGVDGMALVVGG